MLAGITIHNFLLIGFLAVAFIIAFKAVAAKSNIGGLQHIASNI